MSWITIADPLALVAIQAGQVGTPTNEAAAAGGSKLDSEQRSIEIGEPVPIVFGRRRDGVGGVLISPGASEARFENNASNDVTASYLLVLSEGRLDSIPVKDVFQRSCRVGTHSQTYNRRAGTWTPGNFIVEQEGFDKPEASYYCGSIGAYPDMTTVSFQVTIPNGFDQWKKQVHFFIRGGMWVQRLLDSVTGPSDNFADLVRWMLVNSGRLPVALIDVDALTDAARFLEVNGFTCNCWIQESSNYSDLLAKWAPGFLLCESNTAGKRGLRPLLPTTPAGAIDTGVVVPVFTFTEDNITPGSLEIQYTSLAERRPFVVQVIWRQQLEDDFGIIRTAEVRYAGTAETGPYESHDLSEFCTTENHAVKIGAYILAKRTYTSHSLRFTARPQANNTVVTAGSIIRVRLARQTSASGTSYHDYLYQVQRITKTLSGELSYECTHFPIDSQGRSLIALDVTSTSGTGILLTSNKTGVGCDLNSSTDGTIPDETFSLPDIDVNAGIPINIGGGGINGGGDVPPTTNPPTNPDDGLDQAQYPPHSVVGDSSPVTGAGLSPNKGICGTGGVKSLTWFKNGVKITTLEYNNVGQAFVAYENPSDPPPVWLGSYADGIIAIGTGEAGNIYTSVVECNNGTKSGQTTYVEPGSIYNGSTTVRYDARWVAENPIYSRNISTVGQPPSVSTYGPTAVFITTPGRPELQGLYLTPGRLEITNVSNG